MSNVWWKPGDPIPDGPVMAFDTETTIIDLKAADHRYPEPVLASVACRGWERLVWWKDFEAFLRELPEGTTLVAQNASFDFFVTLKVAPTIQTLLEQGRLRCTKLMDQLVRLGQGDGVVDQYNAILPPRSLEKLAQAYGIPFSKDQETRVSFGRLLEAGPEGITHREVTYALKDARVTFELWQKLELEARLLESEQSDRLYPKDVRSQFGLLTDVIQLKGAVALERVRMNGIGVNPERVAEIRREVVAGQTEAAERLRAFGILGPELKVKNPPEGAVWVKDARGRKKWVARWKVNQERARTLLTAAVRGLLGDKGWQPPKLASGKVSLQRSDWDEYGGDVLVRTFIQFKRSEKQLKAFLEKYAGKTRLHPKYRPLVRSGRCSCYSPNLQQVPRRKGSLRDCFVPREGSFFAKIDYKMVELAAVAQLCLLWHHESALAEALSEGRDVHAAVQETLARDGIEVDRTTAKAVNFGFAGGMGAKAFAANLWILAGKKIDIEEAKAYRAAWLRTWPEFHAYLKDRNPSPGRGWAYSDPILDLYEPWDYERCQIFCDPTHVGHTDLVLHLGAQKVPKTFAGWDSLIGRVAVVPTGRVRANVRYTVQRNGPFQGLAADGMKLALHAVARRWPVAAVVHDELLVELPADGYERAEAAVTDVMLAEMKRVIPDVRVGVSISGPLRNWGEKAEERVQWL